MATTPNTYKCTLCSKIRLGRFTRRKGDSNFSPGRTFANTPNWYCWTCLKPGEGRDEGEETVQKKAAEKKSITFKGIQVSFDTQGILVPPTSKAQALTEAGKITALVPSLQQEIEELEITNHAMYEYADELLERVRKPKKVWGSIWARIQEKTIKPIREGLNELYALDKEVSGPFDALEAAVKEKMKAFKLEERRQIAAAGEAQRREDERLQREIDEKQRAAERAATPQMRGRLTSTITKLEEKIEEVRQREMPAPIVVQSSTERTVPKWRIADAAQFYAAIADGTLPMECVLVNVPVMNRHFREDPEGMKAWPGVEVFEDVLIVGR